jgi:hypothetical protein
MRIRRSTPIVGALTQPWGRSAGRWCRSRVWNEARCPWGINWSQRPCASPNLLLPSRRRVSQLLPHLHLPLGLVLLPLPPASENGALLGARFSSPARWHAPMSSRERGFTPMSGVQKPMAVCTWCMRPAFAVVALAHYESLVNGMAAPQRSRSPREHPAPSACRWGCAAPQAGTGVEEFIGGRVCNCFATNAWRSRWSLGMPLPVSLLRRFLVRSVPILVSPGTNDLFAMPAPKAGSSRPSPCSACQTRSQLSSACASLRTAAAKGRQS